MTLVPNGVSVKLVPGRKYLCQTPKKIGDWDWVTFTIVSKKTCFLLDLLKSGIINVYDVQDRVRLLNERTIVHEPVPEDELLLKMLCVVRDTELDFS